MKQNDAPELFIKYIAHDIQCHVDESVPTLNPMSPPVKKKKTSDLDSANQSGRQKFDLDNDKILLEELRNIKASNRT